MSETILEVRGLVTEFLTETGAVRAVDGVSFQVRRGEVLGLVGESGSGKSVTGFSILGLIDAPGRVAAGEVLFKGENLIGKDAESLRRLRGERIAMIFQDPLMTLNPVLRIDTQMIEAIQEHHRIGRAEARARARAALVRVGIPSPDERLENYPHQLSGGMRQRIAIAIALLNEPDLIIADEPTTALDVTIQSQILSEMQTLCAQTGTALIWITHDLTVVAGLADRVAVMYAGRLIELGAVDAVLDAPLHPYTRGLIDSVPGTGQAGDFLKQIDGMTPPPGRLPRGCAFRPRCGYATERCREAAPHETHMGEPQAGARIVRCHHPLPAPDQTQESANAR